MYININKVLTRIHVPRRLASCHVYCNMATDHS